LLGALPTGELVVRFFDGALARVPLEHLTSGRLSLRPGAFAAPGVDRGGFGLGTGGGGAGVATGGV